MSGNERWNRKVFRWCWNSCRVDALTTLSGSVLWMEEAATGRARLPTVESLTDRRHDQTIDGGWNRERRQRVWAVPGTAARYREELGNPARRPCIVCAPVAAANEGWRAHQWCDRSASGVRRAVPPPSAPTDSGRLKVTVKVHTLDIAPLRSESPSQKRADMARVLKGFHSFTCTPTRSSATVVTRKSKYRRRKSVGTSNCHVA